MGFTDATFWVGLTVFGTGLYFLVEKASKRVVWLAYVVAFSGALAVVYAITAHYTTTLPKVPVWLGLLAATWLLIGVDYYDRRIGAGMSTEQFDTPKWELVSGLTFRDTLVKVDSKRFYNCTFYNITFEFAGTGPTEMIGCQTNGRLSVETTHPVARAYSHLGELLTSFPGGKVQFSSYDKDGIPRPSQLKVSEVSPAAMPTLTQLTFALCKELRLFIKEMGPKPELPEGTTENKLHFFFNTVVPWQERLNILYAERFKSRVIDTRYKLKEHNLSDDKLNSAIATDKQDDEQLREIDRGLRSLAAQLED
jgi:hypothetical protein